MEIIKHIKSKNNSISISKLFFFLLVLSSSLSFHSKLLAYDYSLDQFESVNDYYIAFNSGSGIINKSNNTFDFIAGTASLKIDYTYNSGNGSWFSVLKNFNTQTQDWGKQVESWTLQFKGGSQNLTGKLRLWEDHNSDGIFNHDDELFESSTFSLESTPFEQKVILANSFQKVIGNGDDSINLNRIRAYDIVITNQNSGTLSGSLFLDELTINTSYTPPTNGTQSIEGSFIQLWNTVGCKCGQFSKEQWKIELQKMKDACLSEVFIQYSVYDNLSWYSNSSLSFVSSKYAAIDLLLDAAEELGGIKVYLGTYFNENWNSSDKSNSATYSTLLAKQKETINELHQNFGTSTAFSGWYFPQEINDLEWDTGQKKTLLFNYLDELADYAKSKSAEKTTVIAPFFNLWQPADQLAAWYDDLLNTVDQLDRIYFQDGVGITRKDPNFHLPIYFPELKQVCNNHGVSFSVTIESFQQLSGWPIDNGGFTATSAGIGRLNEQLWVAEQFMAEHLIQFSWQYMQPGNSSASDQLYTAYSNRYCSPTSANRSTKQPIVFPNPSNDQFHLPTNAQNIQLYNQEGKLILHQESGTIISLRGHARGVYFCIFQLNGRKMESLIQLL